MSRPQSWEVAITKAGTCGVVQRTARPAREDRGAVHKRRAPRAGAAHACRASAPRRGGPARRAAVAGAHARLGHALCSSAPSAHCTTCTGHRPASSALPPRRARLSSETRAVAL
eukprot:scaffold5009_cov172-Prasinococcus_capsulatus_cf.AAC.2